VLCSSVYCVGPIFIKKIAAGCYFLSGISASRNFHCWAQPAYLNRSRLSRRLRVRGLVMGVQIAK